MTCFVGLDVSMEETAYCAQNAEGRVLGQGKTVTLLSAAPKVVVCDIATTGQVGGNQILEGGAPEDSHGVLAEDIYDVGPRDPRRGTGLGAVVVEQLGKGAAPFLPLDPGNKSGDVVRRGQGGWLRSGWPWMAYRGFTRGKGLGAENGILSVDLTGKRLTR
jgi:hypothetical protein